jgi:hypothetical protein
MTAIASPTAVRPFLMGVETEYAVSGRTPDRPLPTREVYGLLFAALCQERLWIPDIHGGDAVFLENGGRFYLDHGQHPEYASPECFTPAQVAAHDKAGERLLAAARARLRRQRPEVDVTILKNNLHPLFPDDATWGTHESYTCWIDPARAAAPLLPHVVSRIVFAGAGCLSAFPGAPGFELSQRARHMARATGEDTTGARPLFCTRFRKVSDRGPSGWSRVHLICKDSQRAPFGIYLTYGTTGLLFLLLNAGHEVGRGLALADPISALRALSCDPWLQTKVALADGRRLTALEIQESYLAECERAVQHGGFPEWTRELLGHWGRTLADLAKDPLRLAARLDPYCKLMIYGHELRRAGSTWAELGEGLSDLALLRLDHPAEAVQAVLAEDPSALTAEQRTHYEQAMKWAAGGGERERTLERLRLAVRLQRFDLHYHELGGVHDQLAAAGRVDGVVVGPKEIERASFEAPPGGRAAARGRCVKDFRDGGWVCEWRFLHHEASGAFVDLRDPFRGDGARLSWESLCRDQADDPDVQDISCHIGCP